MSYTLVCLFLYIWYQTENNKSLPGYTNTPLPENVGVTFTTSCMDLPRSACPLQILVHNVIDMHACMVYYVYRTKVLHLDEAT